MHHYYIYDCFISLVSNRTCWYVCHVHTKFHMCSCSCCVLVLSSWKLNAEFLQHFYVYIKKDIYFSSLYYHTSLHNPVLMGTSVWSHLRLVPLLQLLPTEVYWEVQDCGGLQWQMFCQNFMTTGHLVQKLKVGDCTIISWAYFPSMWKEIRLRLDKHKITVCKNMNALYA